MKIYDMAQAPNPLRVRIFLAEKGIDMEYVEVNLKEKEHLTEAFLKKNPIGKVPVLEFDDGTCLSETTAICRYFEETHPEPNLMGRNARERAEIEMWDRRVELGFLFPTGFAFQHLTEFFADRMTLIKEWGEQNLKTAKKFHAILDKRLGDSEFIGGNFFSVADITALVTVQFGGWLEITIPPEYKNLIRWHEAVSSRPSVSAK